MSPVKYNPFNPNSVVIPNLFAGRSATVLKIGQKLSQLKHNMPASFFIYGERGIGKTALSKLVRSVAIENDPQLYDLNLLTSYYSVEDGQDLSSVLQSSVNAVTDQMDTSLVDEIGGRLGELFKNGKFKIGAFGASVDLALGDSSLQRDITIKDQTVSILSNILKALKEKQSRDGILIIIDELHNLKDLQAAASVFRNIVTTLDVDGIGQVAFLLIGYDEDVENFFSRDSSARRTFDLHRLGVMPDAEAAEVLRKGFTAGGYEWDEDALVANIKSAGGYPHSIQVLGHNLVEAADGGRINAEVWKQAILRSAKELRSKEFSKMFSFGKPLTEKDKILVEMALSDSDLTRKDIGEKSSSKNIYQELSLLRKAGAIKENDDKTLALHSQLFRTAILFDYYLREELEKAKENGAQLQLGDFN